MSSSPKRSPADVKSQYQTPAHWQAFSAQSEDLYSLQPACNQHTRGSSPRTVNANKPASSPDLAFPRVLFHKSNPNSSQKPASVEINVMYILEKETWGPSSLLQAVSGAVCEFDVLYSTCLWDVPIEKSRNLSTRWTRKRGTQHDRRTRNSSPNHTHLQIITFQVWERSGGHYVCLPYSAPEILKTVISLGLELIWSVSSIPTSRAKRQPIQGGSDWRIRGR